MILRASPEPSEMSFDESACVVLDACPVRDYQPIKIPGEQFVQRASAEIAPPIK